MTQYRAELCDSIGAVLERGEGTTTQEAFRQLSIKATASGAFDSPATRMLRWYWYEAEPTEPKGTLT